MRWTGRIGRAAAMIALGLGGQARATPPRTEVPIGAVILSDGARRYAVPITIDGVTIAAGLDTGSTGLRLLARAAGPRLAAAHGHETRYSYGSGVRFTGPVVTADVALGGIAGGVRLQRVDHGDCTERDRNCATKRLPPETYGIEGDGLAGEGFPAILGTNMADDDAPNPLVALGVTRWIVELPRPGDAAPGRLILQPTDAEVANYRRLPLLTIFAQLHGGLHDAVAGCLVAPGATPEKVCGPVLFDTGAPGIRIAAADPPRVWPQGTPAALVVGDAHGEAATLRFTVGRRDQAAALRTEANPAFAEPRLYTGLLAYFGWSVLYDTTGFIGVAPR